MLLGGSAKGCQSEQLCVLLYICPLIFDMVLPNMLQTLTQAMEVIKGHYLTGPVRSHSTGALQAVMLRFLFCALQQHFCMPHDSIVCMQKC